MKMIRVYSKGNTEYPSGWQQFSWIQLGGGGGGRIKYSGRQGLGRHTLHHIIVEGDNLSRVGSAAVRVHKACHLPTVPT